MTAAFAEVDAAHRPAGRAVLLVLLLVLALAPARGFAQPCTPTATRLCLNGNRFQAEVSWTVPQLGSGAGQALPLTADSGLFWFFSNSNLELTVKVLDGRAINRHFWVFYGGLSNVEYTLTITDLKTGAQAIYRNPAGHLGSGADVSAFTAEAPPAGSKLERAGVVSGATGAPLPVGGEFQVNVTTDGDQLAPAVAVAPDGSFMLVWTSSPLRPAGSQAGVFGRVYGSAGNPRGGEFRLTTTVSSNQREPRVASNAAGQFMAVWTDSGKLVRARLFGSGGEPLSGELALGSGLSELGSPDVTSDPAGGFLVAWREVDSASDGRRIHWQRFDAQGRQVGRELGFDVPILLISNSPRVATSPLGGFLLVWSEGSGFGIDSFLSEVWLQRLDAAGQIVGNPTRVSPDGGVGGLPSVLPVFYADGGFSVIWDEHQLLANSGDLVARRFGADGLPAGGSGPFLSGPNYGRFLPAAVALPSGDTLVLWFDWRVEDPSGGVFSGVFDAAWNLKSPVSRVNTYTPDIQLDPVAAASPAGIVTAWASGDNYSGDTSGSNVVTQDGSDFGVFGQRFTTASCALDAGQLCLGGRFSVTVQFTNPASGASGSGRPLPLTGDTGAFWFFSPNNVELVIKILDGRAVNGRFWVFSGALSDVEYTITVTDTETHQSKAYYNPPHQLASRADTQAF